MPAGGPAIEIDRSGFGNYGIAARCTGRCPAVVGGKALHSVQICVSMPAPILGTPCARRALTLLHKLRYPETPLAPAPAHASGLKYRSGFAYSGGVTSPESRGSSRIHLAQLPLASFSLTPIHQAKPSSGRFPHMSGNEFMQTTGRNH